MTTTKQVFAAVAMTLMSAAAFAQTEDTEWNKNLRPLHFLDTCDAAAANYSVPRKMGSQETAPMQAIGHKRVPVVLAAFSDKKFTAADSTDAGVNAFYRLFCNGTMNGQLYQGHASYGSVRDYFVQQSDSLLFPEFEVIGPVTLDGTCADYGRNSGSKRDVGFADFRNQALEKAMEVYTDWESFDNDGDGTIDMVFFVYAGMGENSGGDADCIWPQESTTTTSINGYKFACSAATNESRPGKSGSPAGTTRTDGIGVFIHEFSHVLGLPDTYDYDIDQQGDIGFGMDSWSVMDYGAYASNGYWPAGYNAYERDFMGWRPLIEIDEPMVLTLTCTSEGGKGYKITNDANPNEYYIIENRQPRNWDQALCKNGHGLQVTHVDYVPQLWALNRINTDKPDHQHLTVVPANNDYRGVAGAADNTEYKEMLKGHLYPGNTYNYNLTDNSTPAARMYTGGLLHKPLRNITENADGTVTVCFRTNGKLDAPCALVMKEDSETGVVTVCWELVTNATRYEVELCDETGEVLERNVVSESDCTFANLQAEKEFTVRVKAMADIPEDYLSSDWTALTFKTLASSILSFGSADTLCDVYTIHGVHVARCRGNEIPRLPRGIYVLRQNNGHTIRKAIGTN